MLFDQLMTCIRVGYTFAVSDAIRNQYAVELEVLKYVYARDGDINEVLNSVVQRNVAYIADAVWELKHNIVYTNIPPPCSAITAQAIGTLEKHPYPNLQCIPIEPSVIRLGIKEYVLDKHLCIFSPTIPTLHLSNLSTAEKIDLLLTFNWS